MSRHRLASDLGRFENRFTWYERAYARSHAVAFEESGGWERAEWNEVLQDLRSNNYSQRGVSNSPLFTDRLMRSSLKHKHVAEYSHDIEKTARPIDMLLREMINPEASFSRLREMDFPTHMSDFALRGINALEWDRFNAENKVENAELLLLSRRNPQNGELAGTLRWRAVVNPWRHPNTPPVWETFEAPKPLSLEYLLRDIPPEWHNDLLADHNGRVPIVESEG